MVNCIIFTRYNYGPSSATITECITDILNTSDIAILHVYIAVPDKYYAD